MLKIILSLTAAFMLSTQAFAANVHIGPGEKFRVGRTTVYCDGNSEQEVRWYCSCYIGFARMGGVNVYASSVKKADELGLTTCQRERDSEVNRVECYEDAR